MQINKTISVDFSGAFRADQFQDEVMASAIIPQLEYIDTLGDDVVLNFDGILLAGELTILDGLIISHVPLPVPPSPDLYVTNGLVQWTDTTSVDRVILGLQTKEIHISKESQGQYSSIKSAILANNNPSTIFIVHPGTYVEDNPLTLPQGASLISTGTAINTFIVAMNPGSDILTLNINCSVTGFSFVGATTLGSRGVYFDCSQSGGQGQFSLVSQCFFRNCDIAIEADGKNLAMGILDTLILREIVITPISQSLSKGLYAHSKGLIISLFLMVSGIPYPILYTIAAGIECADSESKIAMAVTSVWYCDVGLLLDNNCVSEISLLTCKNNGTAVQIGSLGTTTRLSVASLDCKNSALYDMDILSTNATFELHSGFLDPAKINNPNGVKLNSRFHSTAYGKYYQALTGDVFIGTSTNPSQLYIGEGRYETSNIHVFTNDNMEVGVWNDVTYDISVFPSSPVPLFAGSTASNCIYLGRNDRFVVGFKIEVTTAVTVAATKGDLIFEYWNGSSWVSFSVMATVGTAPAYTTTSLFINEIGKYQLRFGITENSPMVKKTLNGEENFWVRIRIVNALTSIPETQYLKFHTNQTEFNKDGFEEYFGSARSISTISSISLANRIGSLTLFTSLNPGVEENVYPAAEVYSVGYKFVNLQKSVYGFNVMMPRNIDTSFPLKIRISFVGSSNIAGDVTWNVRWLCAQPGNEMLFSDAGPFANTAQSLQKTTPISGKEIDIREFFTLDISDVSANPATTNSETVLWVTIERDGIFDTYMGDINITQISGDYVQWCTGGHLSSF